MKLKIKWKGQKFVKHRRESSRIKSIFLSKKGFIAGFIHFSMP